MRFKTLKEETPNQGVDVIIRWLESSGYRYYVTRYYTDMYGQGYFEEADGERYMAWAADEIIGWMYTSELDGL